MPSGHLLTWGKIIVYLRGIEMKITRLIAREIYDSRGIPTVECELTLDNDVTVSASVPSGASVGKHEAHELRDGGKRLSGKGVIKAVDAIEQIIAPALRGKELVAPELDQLLIALDGTPNKKKLGANAILAVSIALYRAQAVQEEAELYELLAWVIGHEMVALPVPMFNLINGGAHADNNLRIQEFMIVPLGAPSYRESLEYGVTFAHELAAVLKKAGKQIVYGDEGGLACDFEDEVEALNYLMDVLVKFEKKGKQKFGIALDVAASQFYDVKKGLYQWGDDLVKADELITFYQQLIAHFPIYSIEDGLAEDDWKGWAMLTKELGSQVQLVGDDLFATNIKRIAQGIELGAANAVLIKPNQIGTVTETMQAIQYCKSNGLNTIISHRSGETTDAFIADLSVGTAAGQIKAGGCCRGERMAKYNRLLTIEDRLMRSLMEQQGF
jgi:enolase